MRICLFTQTVNPMTGAGVFTENLVKNLKIHNPSLTFSFLTSEDLIKPSLISLIVNLSIIRQKIKEADIIHALDGYPYGVVAFLVNFGISKPLIITAVGSGSVRYLKKNGLKSMLLRLAYRKADKVTAISHYVADELLRVLPTIKVEVINHGVDSEFFKPSGTREHAVSYIVTQGEFKRRKGYSEILPIIKKVTEEKPETTYIVVANVDRNKDYQNELANLMLQLNIKEKVVIKSGLSREALKDLYQGATLYLSLPKNVDGDIEGFGLSILEAAACGVPAVVGKGSGADDAVSHDVSGYLVDGNDEKLVVAKIISILDNKDLQKALSGGARKWAVENNWPAKARQYLNIYEKI